MTAFFFDTSALQHRYFDGPKSALVRRIISRRSNECYISETTVLEMASAMGRRCRASSKGLRTYDAHDHAFMKDLHEGRLIVRDGGRAELIRAKALLRYAGVILARNLGTNDALIATMALNFALERSERVSFCMEDWTLFSTISGIQAFKSALKFKFIGTDKSLKGIAVKKTEVT